MIEQVLVISEAHVPVNERRSASQRGLAGFLSIEEWDNLTGSEPAVIRQLPNLNKAVEKARSWRCRWLKLSPDGDTIGDLPEFE